MIVKEPILTTSIFLDVFCSNKKSLGFVPPFFFFISNMDNLFEACPPFLSI